MTLKDIPLSMTLDEWHNHRHTAVARIGALVIVFHPMQDDTGVVMTAVIDGESVAAYVWNTDDVSAKIREWGG